MIYRAYFLSPSTFLLLVITAGVVACIMLLAKRRLACTKLWQQNCRDNCLIINALCLQRRCLFRLFTTPISGILNEDHVMLADGEREVNIVRVCMRMNRLLALIGKNNIDGRRRPSSGEGIHLTIEDGRK